MQFSLFEPIEFLIYLGIDDLWSLYRVDSWFQLTLSNKTLLRKLCKSIPRYGLEHQVHKFDDLVRIWDQNILTSRSHRYVNDEKMLAFACEAGNEMLIDKYIGLRVYVGELLELLVRHGKIDLYHKYYPKYWRKTPQIYKLYIKLNEVDKLSHHIKTIGDYWGSVSCAVRHRNIEIVRLLTSLPQWKNKEKFLWINLFQQCAANEKEMFELLSDGFTLGDLISMYPLKFLLNRNIGSAIYYESYNVAKSMNLLDADTLNDLLMLAISDRNIEVVWELINEGATLLYAVQFWDILHLGDSTLTEKYFVELNIRENERELNEEFSRFADISFLPHIRYLRSKGLNVDPIINTIVTFDALDQCIELLSGKIDYGKILLTGIMSNDYMLVNECLKHLVTLEPIRDEIVNSLPWCTNIKSLKLLLNHSPKIVERSIVFGGYIYAYGSDLLEYIREHCS